jgi:hypothetical protein
MDHAIIPTSLRCNAMRGNFSGRQRLSCPPGYSPLPPHRHIPWENFSVPVTMYDGKFSEKGKVEGIPMT